MTMDIRTADDRVRGRAGRSDHALETGFVPRSWIAGLSLVGAIGHVILGVQDVGHARGWWFVAMALVCVPCAVHLHRSGDRRAWIAAGIGSLSMIVVHLLAMTTPQPELAGAHTTVVGGMSMAHGSGSSVVPMAMSGLLVLEVFIAVLALGTVLARRDDGRASLGPS